MVSVWPQRRLRYLFVAIPQGEVEASLGARMKGDLWTSRAHFEDPLACAGLQELADCIAHRSDEVDDLLAESLLTTLQLRLVHRASDYRQCEGSGREPLQRTLKYVDERLGGPITLTELSVFSGLPRSRLIEAFRAATGRTPHQYIVERRLERARGLLTDSSLPVGQIASIVGCANASHLTKLFNQHLGRSPSAFRQYARRL